MLFFQYFQASVSPRELSRSTELLRPPKHKRESKYMSNSKRERKMRLSDLGTVCIVCVFFPFILDIKFVGHTSRGQEEGQTGFLIHLPSAVRAIIFLARRIQPFLSLVDREVAFCVLTI